MGFVVLLIVVAVGSYYAARFLREGRPRRRPRQEAEFARPLGPDDDDEFLAAARRAQQPDDQA